MTTPDCSVAPHILAFSFGWTEAIIILLVILLLFAAPKLPRLARELAKALRGFKEEIKGGEDKEDEPTDKDAE